jgi:hypothetical protein
MNAGMRDWQDRTLRAPANGAPRARESYYRAL